MLDEIARKVASLGLPGVMFAVAASIAGRIGLIVAILNAGFILIVFPIFWCAAADTQVI
jgi:hypothetical protein